MTRKLLATMAFALLASTSLEAHAAAGGMMASGYQMTASDVLASKLIGSNIYSTVALSNGAASNTPAATTGSSANAPAATANNAAATGAAPATAANANGGVATSANDTNAQQIGTIRDLVMNTDGTVAAVVIGIGGFLGMGEKNVAVAYGDVQWLVAQDGSVRGTLDTTVDALKAAPDFQYPSNGQATNAGNNAAANANMAAPAATTTTMSANTTTAAPAAANAPMVTDPQTFANQAAIGNMFEIQSSQLALKQTKTPNVTAFAQKMITDHGKAAQDMQTAAQSEKVQVPTALDAQHSQQLSQLQGLSGQQFDQAYIRMQVAAHDQAVALFQGYSQSGKAGPLKDFAAKTLPVLQQHQQMIHAMAGK